MPMLLAVPDRFVLVGPALLSTVFLTAWQGQQVNQARNAAGIAYPQMYADRHEQAASRAALVFNCTQRAHQNTLETLPLVLTTTVIAGLTMPLAAATCCGAYFVGRVLYHLGYVTGNPDNRISYGGPLHSVGLLGLMLTSSYSSYKLVRRAL